MCSVSVITNECRKLFHPKLSYQQENVIIVIWIQCLCLVIPWWNKIQFFFRNIRENTATFSIPEMCNLLT